jgi:hypothetical protein
MLAYTNTWYENFNLVLLEWKFKKTLINFSKAQHGLPSSFKVQFISGFLMVKHNITSLKNLKDCKSGYLWGNKFTWIQNHFWKTPKELFSTKVVECKFLKEWFVRFCTKTWHWKNILIVLEWKSLIVLWLVNILEFENIMNRSFALRLSLFKKGTIMSCVCLSFHLKGDVWLPWAWPFLTFMIFKFESHLVLRCIVKMKLSIKSMLGICKVTNNYGI